MTRTVCAIFIVVATSAICLAYALGKIPIPVIVTVTIGLIWLIANQQGWHRVKPLPFMLFIGLCTIGALLHLSRGWLLLGLVGALGAYDLNRFATRKDKAAAINRETAIERDHLRRLMGVVGISLVIGLAASSLTIRIGFSAAVVLGLVVVLCFGQVAGYLRGEK